jgi:phosphate transport system permease protein
LFPWRADALLHRSLQLLALAAGGIVVLIAGFVASEAWPALAAVGAPRFLTDPQGLPAGDPAQARFGLAPMIAGTLAAAVGALLLAVPLGVASAAFACHFATRPVAAVYRRIVELMAGIPSVVYGFWGLVVLAPWIGRWQPPGQSLLTGSLVLALMVLPTVAMLAEAALRAVPAGFGRGAAALGLSRWSTLRGVLLPAAGPGIRIAVLLALGRALGETMALLMVTGNVVQWPRSVFDPVRTLTANIALELGYAMDLHRAALFVSGGVLMLLVVGLVLAAEAPRRRQAHA